MGGPLVTRSTARLSAEDYVVFTALLAVSTFIGLFFAWIDSRKKQPKDSDSMEEDYLVGGRSMSALPVALSLTASFMSSITVISTPAEIYYYGTMFLWFCVSYLLVAVIVSHVYMPFFYRHGYTSSYKYVEERFGALLKLMLCVIYTLNTIIYAGIVIYAPALAIEKVCGVDMDIAIGIMGTVCCIYTSLGGIKAVIWTDVVQYLSMYAGFCAIIYKGLVDLGPAQIFSVAQEHGRLRLDDFSLDPRTRHSVFACVLGGTFGLWLGLYGVNQSNVQRYVSCKSESEARKAVWLNSLALIVINATAAMSGLIMFAYYVDCDPLEAGFISAKDQLAPYLVLDKLGIYRGLPGLYLASACSGTLSTVSSGINAVCAILIDDLKLSLPLVRRHSYFFSRLIVFLSGIGAVLAAFVAKTMTGTVLQAAMSVNGIVAGPVLGLFTVGMFCPWVGEISVLLAFVASISSSVVMYIFNSPTPQFQKLLNVSTEMCSNATQATSMPPAGDVEPGSFEISYIYLSTSGLILTLVLSNVASLVCPPPTQNQRRPVLYSRLIWHISFFSKHWSEEAVDDNNLDAHNKCDKIALIEANCLESSVPSGD